MLFWIDVATATLKTRPNAIATIALIVTDQGLRVKETFEFFASDVQWEERSLPAVKAHWQRNASAHYSMAEIHNDLCAISDFFGAKHLWVGANVAFDELFLRQDCPKFVERLAWPERLDIRGLASARGWIFPEPKHQTLEDLRAIFQFALTRPIRLTA